jgi:hypothetical protein
MSAGAWLSVPRPKHVWLLDASRGQISFAVLGYTRDARGGRIEPVRLSPNLDPYRPQKFRKLRFSFDDPDRSFMGAWLMSV